MEFIGIGGIRSIGFLPGLRYTPSHTVIYW